MFHPMGAGAGMADRLDFEIDGRAGDRADHRACRGARADRGVSPDRDGGGDRPRGQAEAAQARPERVGDGGEPVGDVGGRRRAGRGSRPVPPGQGAGAAARPRAAGGPDGARLSRPIPCRGSAAAAGRQGQRPDETAPLLGLAKANAELVLDLQCRRPVKTATLDIDATVIPCDKRAAKRVYDGNRGYQPVLALWAEQDVILADEFRDGNVPAGCGNRRVVEKALAALPGGIEQDLSARRQRALRARADGAGSTSGRSATRSRPT